MGFFGQGDCLFGREGGNGGDHWGFAIECGQNGFENGRLFREGQRGGLAERTEADDAGAAVFYKPLGMAGDGGGIHIEGAGEGVSQGRHYAGELHGFSWIFWSGSFKTMLE